MGYHRLDDALELPVFSFTGQSRTDVYDAEILSATAGVAADLGRRAGAVVTLGFEAGPAWNRDRYARTTGSTTFDPPPTLDDWTPVFLAVPSLAVRRAVGARVDLSTTGRLLLGFGDLSPKTVPTLAAGVAYRF